MPRNPLVKSAARLEIRLDAGLLEEVQKRAKALGHASTGEYVRSVVKRDLGRRTEGDSDLDLGAALLRFGLKCDLSIG